MLTCTYEHTDAGACQSFAVNHPGSSAYNMRFDEFILIVLHRELLTRSMLKEGTKPAAPRNAITPEADSFDRDESDEREDKDVEVDQETEDEDDEEDAGLTFRVDQIRLVKNIDQKDKPDSRRPNGHPLEPDRSESDLPGLAAMTEEIHTELSRSEEDNGYYDYDPESFKLSWLEVDLTAKRPDGSFVRKSKVALRSKRALEKWEAPLLEFLRSDRLPRKNTVDVIASGPPCQNLTGLAYVQRNKRDTAHKTMVRVLE